jgi:hypothetical protein
MAQVERIVYCGPSLYGVKIDPIPGELWKGPAQQGDLLRDLMAEKPKQIVLIDGIFHHSLAVWHKEIVYALLDGVVCIGAASMGALRAAELHRYGMVGVGKIFEMYRDGEENDALVALTFDPETYRPTFEPAVGHALKSADALAAIDFARSYTGKVETTLDRSAISPYLEVVLKRIMG